MDVTLSVLVPTLGRPSLAATLHECSTQAADQVIAIVDPDGDAEAAWRMLAPHSDVTVLTVPSNEHGGGGAQREAAVPYATGSHLLFMDDDDVYLPGALDHIRATAHPSLPTIYRMQHQSAGLIWARPELRFGNVSTVMLCVPNVPAKLGDWTRHTATGGTDFTFISGTVEKMGAPVWDEQIVAMMRPHE